MKKQIRLYKLFIIGFVSTAAASTVEPSGAIDALINKDMYFAGFCVALLLVLWQMMKASDLKSNAHADQMERVIRDNDKVHEAKDKMHSETIERITRQFTDQIEKLSVMAQNDRKESTAAFRELSTLLTSVIERRGHIDPR